MEKDFIFKLKGCKSAEDLLTLANGNGLTLTEEQSKEYFAKLNANSEITDDELDNVAGGGSKEEEKYCSKCGEKMVKVYSRSGDYLWACPKCDTNKIWQFVSTP